MTNENKQNDQAEGLRRRMHAQHDSNEAKEANDDQQLDVLHLPPRSRVHQKNDEKKKTKIKLKYPIIRLLALLFVLLPIAVWAYHANHEGTANTSFQTDSKSSYKEEISLEEKKQQEETKELTDTKQTDNNENNEEIKTENEEIEETKPSTNNDEIVENTTNIEADKKDYDIVFHTVKQGETLYSISQKYYKNRSGEKLIIEWNQLNGVNIENGQVLKIPLRQAK